MTPPVVHGGIDVGAVASSCDAPPRDRPVGRARGARPLGLVVSAVEASGDSLAAELVTALRNVGPVEASGLAGPAMRGAGVRPLARVEDVASAGLVEIAGRLGPLRAARAALLRALREGADLLLVVDGPDFHLPLARRARRLGIRTVGYVSPQVWAWRPGRVTRVAASLHQLLCLFPFEPALYAGTGLDALWVGHPILDRLAGVRRAPDPRTFALLPGSRVQEVRRLLPVFLEAVEVVRARVPGARFTLGRANTVPRALLARAEASGVRITDGLPGAVEEAAAALVASGTATLECSVLGVPMVVAYAVHPVTWAVGRRVARNLEHMALPNILIGRRGVPEHLQRLDPGALAEDLLRVAEDPGVGTDLAEVRARLGAPGASARAAEALLGGLAPAGPNPAPPIPTPPRIGLDPREP
ncbi:MAG: lipid-A-disaccharide synthase [Deltaproteobacteria bacterium]|nr:lipid-A-disaccharide synthase [Deltaproteobacteria bacterium]